MKPTRVAMQRQFMTEARDILLHSDIDEARSAAMVITHTLKYRPDLAVAPNRVAMDREFLNEVSKLLWHIAEDDRQSDDIAAEAHDLAWDIGDTLVYRQDLVIDGIGRMPTGFETGNYYTNYVENLVTDLYGSEEPTDLRSLTIMLARATARDCDAWLVTKEFAYQNYEVLIELVDSIRRHAADDDETTEEPQIVRSTSSVE